MSKNSPQRIHTEEPKPGSAVLACLYSQTSIAKHPVIRHFGITQRVAFFADCIRATGPAHILFLMFPFVRTPKDNSFGS